ncbi:hypothetical protein A2U01_0078667, partial [Trifolium medium]|nr:hypothetical protein [Trifolium medium]
MAPVESFLDLCFGLSAGGIESGDGAGAGKNGVHDFNGGPQRSKFPAKDDSGNFESVLGIEPLRLLLETSKPFKFAVMLGRLPENVLFS